jgi:hypothetical protein
MIKINLIRKFFSNYISKKKFDSQDLYKIYDNTKIMKTKKFFFLIFTGGSIFYCLVSLYHPTFINKFMCVSFFLFASLYAKFISQTFLTLSIKKCGKVFTVEKMRFFDKSYFQDFLVKDFVFQKNNDKVTHAKILKRNYYFYNKAINDLESFNLLNNDEIIVENEGFEKYNKKKYYSSSKIF